MIILKTKKQINKIKKSCEIVAYILKVLYDKAVPGTTTLDLNNIAEKLCGEEKVVPAFKGYRGYPFSICSSRNQEVVHGFPSNTPLASGEILSIDFGVICDGWYGDSAFTKGIGQIDESAEKLIKVTNECLSIGINSIVAYGRLGDVSRAIQEHAEHNNFGIVREFVGHGIGRELHEDPQIPNYGHAGVGPILKPGLVIALEPMLTEGSNRLVTLTDGWTTVTEDGKLSAHFEHTVAITDDGIEVLTNRD